ncbi:MAG: hypothetical protein ACREQA_06080 [Candidatus Binatia bacterium]
MRRLLDSDLELVVQSGFMYVPLLLDPAIEREIDAPRKGNNLITVNGRRFIKTLSLQSLVENYEKIDTESYEQLRGSCLQKYCHPSGLGGISISGMLRTILFDVMPHFIRRSKGLERRRRSEGEILGLIREKINIPGRYYEDATKFVDRGVLLAVLDELQGQGARIEPPKDGLIEGRTLREWLLKAMELKIVEREKDRLRQTLQEREQFVEAERKDIATLLYIAEKGSLEIDGFGFSRMGLTDEYLIYKHTGEYALKDFYGRIYLFPDCRVAVSTIVPLRPLVIDTYKHPFLEGHDSGQHICLRHFSRSREFTAANAMKALEEGINALLYGYSSRRRNGYHSLDRITGYIGTVDFDDSIMSEHDDDPMIPTRRVRIVNFDGYRVSKDHPQIASGQVEITNNYTP